MILIATAGSFGGGAGSKGGARRAPRRAPGGPGGSLGPAGLDLVERRLGVLLTGDPGGHLLPEGARADGPGHLVGPVEDPLRRLVLDLRKVLRCLAGVAAEVDILARGQVPGGLLRHVGLELAGG